MVGFFTEDICERFVAGGVAGAVAKSVIAPLDRVKVLFQTTTRLFTLHNGWKEMFRIQSQEGFRAFWKGNCAQILRIMPYTAIVRTKQQFSSFDYYKSMLPLPGDSKLAVMARNFLPGSLAGATGVILTYPFEVARTRLAVQTTRRIYKGTFHAFWKVYKEEGISTLYRGIQPTMLGILVYSGVAFGVYFGSKDIVTHTSIMQHFLYGAAAGILGQFSAYPFDVVRKKMQACGFIERVSDFKSTYGNAPLQYASFSRAIDFTREIWEKEGLRGFFKGFSVNIVKAPLGAGIVHSANELIKQKMKTYWD